MKYAKLLIEMWVGRGEALIHYSTVIEWYYSSHIDQDTWDKYCLACLEELMKKNEKVLDKLKSM